MRKALLTLTAMAMLATVNVARAENRLLEAEHCFMPTIGHKQSINEKGTFPFTKTDSEGYQFRELTRGASTVYFADLAPESKISRQPEESTVTITVKLDYDKNRFAWTGHMVKALHGRSVECVFFDSYYDEETGNYYSSDVTTAEVPAGTYDFATEFYDFVDNVDVLMVLENVEVSEGSEVAFRPAEAQNTITFEPLLPNGEKINLPLASKDEEGNLQLQEEGNVNFLLTNFTFHYGQRLGGVVYYTLTDHREIGDPENYSLTIRCNDVSDNYFANLITGATIFSGKRQKEYYSNISPDQLVTGIYQTDIQNYTDIRWNGAKGDFGKYDVLGQRVDMIGFDSYIYGRKFVGFTHGWRNSEGYEELMFAPSSGNSAERLTVGYRPYIHEYTYDMSENPEYYHDYLDAGCWGQPIFFENGDWSVKAARYSDYTSYFFTEDAYGESEIQWFPTHERFDYTADDTDIVLGNSVPIINTLPLIWHTDWMNPENCSYPLGVLYCGRLGEYNQGCLNLTDYSVQYNGEIVGEGDAFARQFLGPWWYGGSHEPGVYDYAFTESHVLVDGAPASVTANVHIDQTTGDMEAPTLQHLMTRDADDFITDRFASPKGAFIELCGGDFRPYEKELYQSIFNYEKAAEVKAEWAVKDSDEWYELEVAEVPGGYRQGWGDLYRVELDDINQTSDSKWYDLRITIVDNAGNYQQQVLSPAFSIENVIGGADIELYAVGSMTDDAIDKNFKFTQKDGVFTLTKASMEGELKITTVDAEGNPDWTAVDFGGGFYLENGSYSLVWQGEPLNIAMTDVTLSITYDLDTNSCILSVEGTQMEKSGQNPVLSTEGAVQELTEISISWPDFAAVEIAEFDAQLIPQAAETRANAIPLTAEVVAGAEIPTVVLTPTTEVADGKYQLVVKAGSFTLTDTEGNKVASEVITASYDVVSHVEGLADDEGEVVWFNLQGVRVDNPSEGIFIRVANGKAQKVVNKK